LLKDRLLNSSVAIEEYEQLVSQIDSVNQLLKNYKLNLIEKHPDLFVAKLLNAMRDVEIPDSITNSSDSTLAYKYLKQHYWDYFDLSDERLLRTPLLSKKVNEYFTQMVVIQPDSVIAAIDEVISMARPSEEVVGFLLWHFVSDYQNPKYMGFEKVFIHLVDAYFSKEQVMHTTPSVLQTLQERADVLRPLQLGETAPNLMLIDTNDHFRSFRDINSDYIVLLFWDYDCSFCRKEIKFLKSIYKQSAFDFEIYAINVNGDHEKWKKTVHERGIDQWLNVNGTLSRTADFHDLYDVHGSPVIYLLDSQKKIIAKRIGAEQIIPFLENYEKNAAKQ
jgi:thiol-disulfide isomerase/thioredoxin